MNLRRGQRRLRGRLTHHGLTTSRGTVPRGTVSRGIVSRGIVPRGTSSRQTGRCTACDGRVARLADHTVGRVRDAPCLLLVGGTWLHTVCDTTGTGIAGRNRTVCGHWNIADFRPIAGLRNITATLLRLVAGNGHVAGRARIHQVAARCAVRCRHHHWSIYCDWLISRPPTIPSSHQPLVTPL